MGIIFLLVPIKLIIFLLYIKFDNRTAQKNLAHVAGVYHDTIKIINIMDICK